MSRRIDIELTSSRPDGSWTWRAAGARVPKGVVDGSVLPAGAKVGDELKVEVEQELEGLTVLGVVQGRAKNDRAEVIELLPSERPFEPVTEQRARRDDRGPRRPRRDDRGDRADRGDRRDRDDRRPPRDDRTGGADRAPRGDRPPRTERGATGRGDRGGAERGPGERGARPGGDRRPDRRQRPSFTPPPELPQRPKPKRLRPGSARRNEVLAGLPEEQRPIAELALQGMPAVRQRLRDENRKLSAAGKPVMPEASVLKLAEDLLPTLRVAEWLDRAEAAQRQLEHLDLRDLRSVVASGEDPLVVRDDSTRELAGTLKTALATKQEQELQLWFGDIDAALGVGRVIRALRLSSQPPKAGVPFPPDIAQRLVDAAVASLTPGDGPDRWAAVLEAAAFSPVHAQIAPTALPQQVTEELRTTVTRLAPALPRVAALFGIEAPPNASMPKPLRPQPRPKAAKEPAKPPRQPAAPASTDAPPSPAPDARPEPSPDAPSGAAPSGAADEPPGERDETPPEQPRVDVVEQPPEEPTVEVVEEPPAEIVETPTVEVVEDAPARIVETPTVEVVEETPARIVETPTVEVVEDARLS